jgi:hypothetical protein
MPKSQKDIIRDIKNMINPEGVGESKLLNLLDLISRQNVNLPPVMPATKAPKEIEPTMGNIATSINQPEMPLARNYPFRKRAMK